tara:strand:+ start:277 stop:897 length:621 start_codon:yes stop_codon:yes gene_type:complete
MLLSRLPTLGYNLGKSALDPDFILTKNFWRRAEILSEYQNSVVLFDEYIVQNGERPEDIALHMYDNPFYNWTVLIINDIVNFYDQWPRSTMQLQEYVSSKYSNPSATKHYVTTEVKDAKNNVIIPAGKVVPQNFQVAYWNGSVTVTANPTVSISNYQYEEEINSKKEKIQIVRADFIEDFVSKYYELCNKNQNMSIGISAEGVSMG